MVAESTFPLNPMITGLASIAGDDNMINIAVMYNTRVFIIIIVSAICEFFYNIVSTKFHTRYQFPEIAHSFYCSHFQMCNLQL